jgi:hypothetical protein
VTDEGNRDGVVEAAWPVATEDWTVMLRLRLAVVALRGGGTLIARQGTLIGSAFLEVSARNCSEAVLSDHKCNLLTALGSNGAKSGVTC